MTEQEKADRRMNDRVVAGDMLDAACRALQFPPSRASLRTAYENAEAAVAAIRRMIDAHDAVMLRIMLP
jgi:hypothetical protein